jgi:hypothetical protein
LRIAPVKILLLISALGTLATGTAIDRPALQPYPGTGMFLLLSDIHFDPFADPAVVRQLGATPLAACQSPASSAFAHYGSDTNYPLLRSTLDHAAATARENHFHYDYVIVTGDFLAHHFDLAYRKCVGGDAAAYTKFAGDTVSYVDAMIRQALPGVPVFAALGNNDSDTGDYIKPTEGFMESVGRDWSQGWGKVTEEARTAAIGSFEGAGYYSLPNPAAPHNELIILNSNLWAARNASACGEHDDDPGLQFEWLEKVLGKVKSAGRSATLIMHILPGIDAMRSSVGAPRTLWTDACTDQLTRELTEFRGTAREMFAGHIHRDDFRIFPDREGKPLLPIHVAPAVSPVYLDNPAVEIGWYDKKSGELRDYAALYLDLGKPSPAWATEYVFSRAYGSPRPDLAGLEMLGRRIHQGNPRNGVGKLFAGYYGAGASVSAVTSDTWLTYSCAQTEITPAGFAQCRGSAAQPGTAQPGAAAPGAAAPLGH